MLVSYGVAKDFCCVIMDVHIRGKIDSSFQQCLTKWQQILPRQNYTEYVESFLT